MKVPLHSDGETIEVLPLGEPDEAVTIEVRGEDE